MNFLKLLLLLSLVMAIAVTISAVSETENSQSDAFVDNDDDNEAYELPSESELISLRGPSRFLAQQKTRSRMTCNKYPRICRVKGSPGPDCCKKKCVNVSSDRVNCGKCGKKCKYHEICCKGKCVNPYSNKKHCGGCGNGCDKASSCVYGMCSYAN